MLTLLLAGVIMTETFNYPDGLITNEYAYVNPTAPDRKVSPLWEVTNGSLFAASGQGWTGKPDAVAPNALSTNGTSSSAFRARTRRTDLGDIEVTFKLLNRGLSSNSKYPAVAWDGAHVWLRYVSEYSLYAVSVNRRDGNIVIKKKVPGGSSNGGTYYDLAWAKYAAPYGAWQTVKVSAANQADGSVKLQLWLNGSLRLTAVDKGTGGAPIRAAGRVGLRGDNADLKFEDFVVTSLAASSAPTFSGVGSTNVQTASADIVWETDIPADSQVEWGPTSAFGSLTPLAATKVLKHVVRLANLKAGTRYYYRVRSNGAVEKAVHAFTTKVASSGDTTPPVVLSAGSTNVTATSADVVWTTNEAATSQVEYGLTSSYGTYSTHFTTLLTSHKVKVYGLRPGTKYYYRLRGRDAAGNLRVDSVVHGFTTKAS